MNIKSNNHKRSQRGQSLVEVALFLPIFILLLAGLVEVSQLLITQNRISSAARAGTRFASNGGENIGVVDVVLNTVTQTLETDNTLWDLWVIHGTVNENGDAILDWEFDHEYGISNTVRSESVDQIAIQSRILAELQQDENKVTDNSLAADLKFVATYVIHDVNSILGLNALPQFDGVMSRDALSVMRITAEGNEVTNGCAAFPIAVRKGIRSVTDPNDGEASAYDFPNESDFFYPTTNWPTYQQFINHTPDRPLEEAQKGWVFRIYNGGGSGNFGWLYWNQGITANAPNLANSLAWPGTSTDYNDYGDGGSTSQINGWGDYRDLADDNYVPRGYIEPGNVADQALHVGDYVAGDTGTVNSKAVRDALNEHIQLDRTLRVIVWDDTPIGTGNNLTYIVDSFAIFRLVGYDLTHDWILAEFIGWDTSCGQNPDVGP